MGKETIVDIAIAEIIEDYLTEQNKIVLSELLQTYQTESTLLFFKHYEEGINIKDIIYEELDLDDFPSAWNALDNPQDIYVTNKTNIPFRLSKLIEDLKQHGLEIDTVTDTNYFICGEILKVASKDFNDEQIIR